MKTTGFFTVGTATLVLLTGCVTGPATEPPPATVDATVEMGLISFVPETIRIRPGQTVQWRNTSINTHTVTGDPALASNPANVSLPKNAKTFRSGSIEAGQTFERTFTVPGTYRYTCLPHEALGMQGTIIVEAR
ncbi:cupredoxin domain-containing protein [Chelativorans salis]|uniref:Plastocyanin/azurin family copper-binding protein n=1 Tax=Chelativorans salis TaxID=2978478 RepID=A0ABT2LXD3_9HYPH|nr:plastocyanin/azurin family copper-binding protein [Chelativorans sp. EGI FJ00035]MCT7378048.1 plastocyanin/azurin family copper-binding protein [Chelativorans sp. EGI FJ00035]